MDYQVVHIINKVLITAVVARCAVYVPSQADMKKWDIACAGVRKMKAGLARDCPVAILHHGNLYGLRSIQDAIEEAQVMELMVRLNAPPVDTAGRLARTRVEALQWERVMTRSPVEQPTEEEVRQGRNLAGRVLPIMCRRGIAFSAAAAHEGVSGQLAFVGLLGPWPLMQRHRVSLRRHGLLYVEQDLDAECARLLDWTSLQRRLPTLGRQVPGWYRCLEECLRVTGEEQFQAGHGSQWATLEGFAKR